MGIPKKLRSTKGVTLLEVMVALAITSIALISLISLVTSSMEMEEYARRLTDASTIADNKLKDIERIGIPEPGTTEGLVDEENPQGFQYRQTVSETPIDDVYLVEVEVFWDKKTRSTKISAYMLKK
mgnify:CR=1 FL=1